MNGVSKQIVVTKLTALKPTKFVHATIIKISG
jgi:hypothetical protein